MGMCGYHAHSRWIFGQPHYDVTMGMMEWWIRVTGNYPKMAGTNQLIIIIIVLVYLDIWQFWWTTWYATMLDPLDSSEYQGGCN